MPVYPGKNSEQQDFIPSNQTLGIFLISVLGLFLEMLLIRWIGTEIRIFAYLQNTILVMCFLGLGLGCFTSSKPIQLRKSLIPLAFILLLMAIPVSRGGLGLISELLSSLGDINIWASAIGENSTRTILFVGIGLITTYFVMILIVDIFVPIGRILGRLMDHHPNTILAYSSNIAGSLAGTWLFVVMSYFYQPPITWFLCLSILFLVFIIWMKRDWKINLALIIAIVVFSWFAGIVNGSLKVFWSPYQKLVVGITNRVNGYFGDYIVMVNNTGYQMMADLRDSHTSLDPERYPSSLQGLSQYDIPLLLHANPQKILIVGAGTGNDAAGAIRQGAKDITAVEIDPAIIQIGKEMHPENPYSSPYVHIVNDDARSFFATTKEKFDVISFGLLDSHTTTSLTNARLDHYVYTRESILRAKSLLTEHGILVLTFEAQRPFIADRIDRVLGEVFDEKPISFRIPPSSYGWGGVMFIAGDLDQARNQIAQNPRLSTWIDTWQKESQLSFTHQTKVATDDWPYLYLEKPQIPILYYLLAVVLLFILVRSSRRWQASDLITRWNRNHWHFFFLGAAFLLLEVQNISKASVVLGNTWQVNAVIASGVFIMALAANWLAYRFPRIPLSFTYIALIGICLILYFVDLARFGFLPYTLKATIVGGLTTLPMLFSGIIFIRSFAEVEQKNEALGANLIGSLVGALLQSITFITGIKALLLLVAALYFLSSLTIPRFLYRDSVKFIAEKIGNNN